MKDYKYKDLKMEKELENEAIDFLVVTAIKI